LIVYPQNVNCYRQLWSSNVCICLYMICTYAFVCLRTCVFSGFFSPARVEMIRKIDSSIQEKQRQHKSSGGGDSDSSGIAGGVAGGVDSVQYRSSVCARTLMRTTALYSLCTLVSFVGSYFLVRI
jgi:hypothetical protein